jgi:hypothetical protein
MIRLVSTLVSDTVIQTVPVDTDEGDHDRYSHWALKNAITEAHITGKPVIALCGKVWVPSRDPKRYPVCPDCQRIYDSRK